MLKILVDASESGQKAIKYLLRKTDGTKVYLYKLFRKGRILINGRKAGSASVIRQNDEIYSQFLELTERKDKFLNIPDRLDVLYSDDQIIAVDKDEKTAVHSAQNKDYQNSLNERVKAYLYRNNESYEFIVPVHRIDKSTAGIVLFARNYKAARKFSEYFREGKVIKIYQALLCGSLKEDLFIEADIARLPDRSIVTVKNLKISNHIPDKENWLEEKYARSPEISATVIKPRSGSADMTLCEVEIWTGRHHQIRAVCQAAGHPVAGDLKYGGGKEFMDISLICKKMMIKEINLSIESKYKIKWRTNNG